MADSRRNEGNRSMKGFSFHAEMPRERGSKAASKRYPHAPWTRATLKAMAERGERCNVSAVFTDRAHWRVDRDHIIKEAISAVLYSPNSPVSGTEVSDEWLRRRTVRIDEATARKLHPTLFAVLDYEPNEE